MGTNRGRPMPSKKERDKSCCREDGEAMDGKASKEKESKEKKNKKENKRERNETTVTRMMKEQSSGNKANSFGKKVGKSNRRNALTRRSTATTHEAKKAKQESTIKWMPNNAMDKMKQNKGKGKQTHTPFKLNEIQSNRMDKLIVTHIKNRNASVL